MSSRCILGYQQIEYEHIYPHKDNYYAAVIKSSLFKNLNKIEQHKLVYKSLKGKMGNELHALSITTEGK